MKEPSSCHFGSSDGREGGGAGTHTPPKQAGSQAHPRLQREREPACPVFPAGDGANVRIPGPASRPPSDRWEGGRGTGRRQFNSAGASERVCVGGGGWGLGAFSQQNDDNAVGRFTFSKFIFSDYFNSSWSGKHHHRLVRPPTPTRQDR